MQDKRTTTFSVCRTEDGQTLSERFDTIDEALAWGWANVGRGFQVDAHDPDGTVRLVAGQP